MPLIAVKVFKNELDQQQSAELIARITDAVTAVTHEKLRDVTWVVIDEVKDGHWGVGGKALALEDVKRLMAQD